MVVMIVMVVMMVVVVMVVIVMMVMVIPIVMVVMMVVMVSIVGPKFANPPNSKPNPTARLTQLGSSQFNLNLDLISPQS